MDLRSPFVLDTRELGRQAGSVRDYRRELSAPPHLGLDMVGVAEGAPLALSVRLEAVTEGVLVTGSVSTEVNGQCGRCLNDYSEGLEVQFDELFAYPNSTTDRTTEADEVGRIEGDHLDLEPVVRDTVVLSLPLTPLCSADCAGLCSDCGERLDDLPADHSHATLDPRWAALMGRFDGSTSSTESQE